MKSQLFSVTLNSLRNLGVLGVSAVIGVRKNYELYSEAELSLLSIL